ncbi:MAG: hypothetical protein JXA73_11780 [Acidobacteria bacterium]|nr:hypothetical protein [Acidobacteriota bacterium]
MPKLKDYELANLAAWCFDYRRAAPLFEKLAVNSFSKDDLLGTWGAMESLNVSRAIASQSWEKRPQRAARDASADEHISGLADLLISTKDDVRRTKLRSIVAAKEREFRKQIRDHGKRLRDLEEKDRTVVPEDEKNIGLLSYSEEGSWTYSVQRLASLCIGRAYRNDGLVPDMIQLHTYLVSVGTNANYHDDRCILIPVSDVVVEVWFDGRVSCLTATAHDRVILPALRSISALCDRSQKI